MVTRGAPGRQIALNSSNGWRQALLSVPRVLVGNYIALLAARRALFLYIEILAGGAPHWDKTDHQFPADVERVTG